MIYAKHFPTNNSKNIHEIQVNELMQMGGAWWLNVNALISHTSVTTNFLYFEQTFQQTSNKHINYKIFIVNSTFKWNVGSENLLNYYTLLLYEHSTIEIWSILYSVWYQKWSRKFMSTSVLENVSAEICVFTCHTMYNCTCSHHKLMNLSGGVNHI